MFVNTIRIAVVSLSWQHFRQYIEHNLFDMKNFVYFVFALCVAFVSSCTESEDSGNISISGNKSISSSSEGGDFKVSFTAIDAWYASVIRVTKSDTLNWISISPDSGTAGECTVDVSVSPNYGSESRKAGIVISCAGETVTVTVTQKGSSDDEGSVVPDTAVVVNPKRLLRRIQSCDGTLCEDDVLFRYVTDDELGYMEATGRDGNGEMVYVEKTTISRDNNNIVVISDYLEEFIDTGKEISEDRYVYVLNDDGTIGYCEEAPDRKFVYDNGRLVKAYSMDDGYATSYDFVWNSGNLTSMASGSYDEQFVYSKYLCDRSSILDINWMLGSGYHTGGGISIAGFAGLLGKKSENIVIPVIDGLSQNQTEANRPEYLLASDDGKEVRRGYERLYSSDDVTFTCELGEKGRLTFLRAEADAIKEVYETIYRYVINFDGYSEEVGGETRYYDFEIEFVKKEMVSSEITGKCFNEVRLEY